MLVANDNLEKAAKWALSVFDNYDHLIALARAVAPPKGYAILFEKYDNAAMKEVAAIAGSYGLDPIEVAHAAHNLRNGFEYDHGGEG